MPHIIRKLWYQKSLSTWMDWSNIQIFSSHSSWKIPSDIRIVILNILSSGFQTDAQKRLLSKSRVDNLIRSTHHYTGATLWWILLIQLTFTILVMISEVEIPSVLSVTQNISFDLGSAYVSEKRKNISFES